MTRLIDADKAIEATWEQPTYTDPLNVLTEVRERIRELPTVEAMPIRHGKWIYSNDFHWYTASCNKCGYQRRTDIKAEGWNQWKYCPNCGARMDEE